MSQSQVTVLQITGAVGQRLSAISYMAQSVRAWCSASMPFALSLSKGERTGKSTGEIEVYPIHASTGSARTGKGRAALTWVPL